MKKINFRKTLFAAVLLFQLNAIAAFGQTVVKGSVKDNTGKPISGVVVTDGAHFNTTDAEGNYVLNTDPTRYPMNSSEIKRRTTVIVYSFGSFIQTAQQITSRTNPDFSIDILNTVHFITIGSIYIQ